ncbi:MAG TPA: dihydrofolate reductase [Thermoanaerobaculia bacterium]|nr:dihydrofolate reductase [Thermoanaerobaculia bacterium]
MAVARNGVIGADGRLPWHLPDDLRRFKRLTLGHVLLMGRKTFESIGKPLPGRRTIVLSRSDWRAEGVETARDSEQALELAAGAPEIFVAGGEEVYRRLLPLADRLLVTWVDASPAGDAHWPEVPWDQFRVVEESEQPADDRNRHASRFVVYERVAAPAEGVSPPKACLGDPSRGAPGGRARMQ